MAGPLNRLDLVSGPIFAGTMLWEHRTLSKRDRLAGDIVDRPVPAGEPDPLVPLGYERNDTIDSLTMLAGSVVVNVVTAGVLAKLHEVVFRRRVANLGSMRGALAVAMLAWDFLYYWDHRWMHEVRLLWGNHVAHHSSQRYNLSTALRQPWAAPLTAYAFVPLPLLGFSARQVRLAGQLNLLYQYWIHTEAIDRLPRVAEQVLNTPSHHRAHHGVNKEYLDRNYGGILILWDRLFGTFEPEVRRVRYGLTTNITTRNPLRIAYQEFIDISSDVLRRRGIGAKLRAVFGRPVSAVA